MQLPLLAELNRRRVFRALVGYGIAAFAVLQIIEPVMHGLHWPNAVLSYVVVALAIGFPIVVALAWIFDVKGGGIERTMPASAIRGPPLTLVLICIGLMAAAPGVVWYFVIRGIARPGADDPKSIAVLPLASLNAGEDAAYFADGIHGDLLMQLSKISDLKVISRTSVLQYRHGTRNLREIGEALGVATVLEGSVQRVGNRVRIEAQLIDARQDHQIWAERYDRELTDVFTIQSAVAEEIAKALHARLSSAEKTRIERKPTQSAEAYDLYLRGRDYELRPGFGPRDLQTAEQMYGKAIQRDPSFALARARLAIVHASAYWFGIDPSRARLADAKSEADQAFLLQPDLAESHAALGWFHYVQRDYDPALKEFELAHSAAPGNVEVLMSLGFVERRRGRFEEAHGYIAQGVRLDPRSTDHMDELGNTCTIQRLYPDAVKAYERALASTPEYVPSAVNKARVELIWKGEAGAAKAAIARFPAGSDPGGKLTAEKYLLELFKTFPAEAWATLSLLPLQTVTTKYEVVPKALFGAMAADARGDQAGARAFYESARALLEPEVKAHPDDYRYRPPLGRVYAGLGLKQDAVREGKRAVELLPISRDAFDGAVILEDLAAIQAQVGDADAALEIVEKLLAMPSYLSAALLRIDPKWTPLRNNARFRKLAGL